MTDMTDKIRKALGKHAAGCGVYKLKACSCSRWETVAAYDALLAAHARELREARMAGRLAALDIALHIVTEKSEGDLGLAAYLLRDHLAALRRAQAAAAHREGGDDG